MADEGHQLLLRLASYRHLDGEQVAILQANELPLTCSSLQYFITFLSSLSFFPVAVYLSTYVDSLASSLSATTVLAVFNAASVVGQVYVGVLSDKYDKAWIIAGLGIGSALSAFLAWGFGDTLAKVFGFCILYVSLVCHRVIVPLALLFVEQLSSVGSLLAERQ